MARCSKSCPTSNISGFVDSIEKDLGTRRGLLSSVLHNMKKLWTSALSTSLKRSLFISTIESVLLYGAETWTITIKDKKSLDRCYTRMLRMALNVSWQDYMRNVDLYNGMQRVTDKIRERRLNLAGHCVHHPELAAHPTILWEPTQGTALKRRKRLTLVDQLKRDTDPTSAEELRSCMAERDNWRKRIRSLAHDVVTTQAAPTMMMIT